MKTIDELWKKLKDVELVQVHPEEMEALYNRCVEFRAGLVVEIGSAHGASSIILAEAMTKINGQVVCVDNFIEGYEGQDKFGDYARKAFKKNTKGYKKIKLVDKSSSEAFNEIIQLVNDLGEIDILFIDGDHSYEAVSKDCTLYLPLLRHAGYVAFHDYNNVAFSGVKKAADDFTSTWETTDNVWDMIIRRKP